MKYRVKVLLAFIVLTAVLEAGGEKEQFKIMQLEIEQTELIPNIIKNFVAVKMHFKYGTPQATLEKTVARFDQINKTFRLQTGAANQHGHVGTLATAIGVQFVQNDIF